MRLILLILFIAFAAPAAAGEVSIEFRHHPDQSGQKTTNQSISAEADDGAYEAEVEEEGPDGGEREIQITKAEYDAMLKLVSEALRSFKLEQGQDIEGAYVEVMLEFEGEDRELEITLIYPAGQVPQPYVQLQRKYFKRVYE